MTFISTVPIIFISLVFSNALLAHRTDKTTLIAATDGQGIGTPVYAANDNSVAVNVKVQTNPSSSIESASAYTIRGSSNGNHVITNVEIALRNESKHFWNGTEFSSLYARVQASIESSGDWHYDIVPALSPGKYYISAIAFDDEGNHQSPFASHTFTVGQAASSTHSYTTIERSQPINGEAIDGEGFATISGVDSLIAGEITDFKIRFTAGPSGVPVGGGISVGFHHASSYWVQTTNPIGRHYVKAQSPFPDNINLRFTHQAPIGMLINDGKYNPDTMFHSVVVAKVIREAIPPRGVVEFHFGANPLGITTPVFIDADHQFRVTTDIDGDGTYRGIAHSPTIEIVHAAATNISAVIPSQSVAGEFVDVLVRVEDKHQNLAASFSDTVNIVDEAGQILVSNLPIERGLARTQLTLSTVGPHRLRLATNNTGLTGRSNPTRVFTTKQTRGIYWGDLHGHTGESDALGFDANEFFAFGRDVAALDIIALTDHSTPNWPANIKAVQDFYEPDNYVTILGFETASRNNQLDHMNVYFREDSKTEAEVVGDGWAVNYQALQKQVFDLHNSDQPNAFMGPHHTSYDRGIIGDPNYPFGHWDNRVARFFEIYSSHGTSEFEGNPRPLRYSSSDPDKYMQGGLAMGKKFAVIGASDNHDSKPGRSAWGYHKGGLAGVWTTDLTRESVWQAIWNFSTFGTSTDRIYLDFSINGEPMGSTIDTNNPVNIQAYIIGKTDVLNAVLIKDNQEIQTFNTNDGLLEIDFTDTVSADGHFYYLRVTQDNGERAWSTPIWIE